jgi:hypothetical protein
MSAELTPVAEDLHRMKRELQQRGLLQEFAFRVGTYRRWKQSRDAAETSRNWLATVCHQLSERHAFQLSYRDWRIGCELIGFDPAARKDWAA